MWKSIRCASCLLLLTCLVSTVYPSLLRSFGKTVTKQPEFLYEETDLSTSDIAVKKAKLNGALVACAAIALARPMPLIATMFRSGDISITADASALRIAPQRQSIDVSVSGLAKEFIDKGTFDGKMLTVLIPKLQYDLIKEQISINHVSVNSLGVAELVSADSRCLASQKAK